MTDHAARGRAVLAISVAVTVALYVIPGGYHVAYPLILISTLVHELGHGIAAVFMGARFLKFHMNADGSGVAYWSGHVGSVGRAFISAGGLVGPALLAAVAFVVARRARFARWALGVGAGLLLALGAWVVRGQFGLVFVLILAAACLAIALKGSEQLAHFTLVFLAVQLALSVYSRGDYLFVREARPGMPSDVEQMARALGGPYWLWGWICGAFSVVVLAVGGWLFLRAARRQPGGTMPTGAVRVSR